MKKDKETTIDNLEEKIRLSLSALKLGNQESALTAIALMEKLIKVLKDK